MGEKTVMEELNELPDERIVVKSPATDSLAEPEHPEAPELGDVSYPDSLRGEEETHDVELPEELREVEQITPAAASVKASDELEVSKSLIGHLEAGAEMPSAMPSSLTDNREILGDSKTASHEEIISVKAHGMEFTVPPEDRYEVAESPAVESKAVLSDEEKTVRSPVDDMEHDIYLMQHHDGLQAMHGFYEREASQSPVHHEEASTVSKSPVEVIPPSTPDEDTEFESKPQGGGMQFAMTPRSPVEDLKSTMLEAAGLPTEHHKTESQLSTHMVEDDVSKPPVDIDFSMSSTVDEQKEMSHEVEESVLNRGSHEASMSPEVESKPHFQEEAEISKSPTGAQFATHSDITEHNEYPEVVKTQEPEETAKSSGGGVEFTTHHEVMESTQIQEPHSLPLFHDEVSKSPIGGGGDLHFTPEQEGLTDTRSQEADSTSHMHDEDIRDLGKDFEALRAPDVEAASTLHKEVSMSPVGGVDIAMHLSGADEHYEALDRAGVSETEHQSAFSEEEALSRSPKMKSSTKQEDFKALESPEFDSRSPFHEEEYSKPPLSSMDIGLHHEDIRTSEVESKSQLPDELMSKSPAGMEYAEHSDIDDDPREFNMSKSPGQTNISASHVGMDFSMPSQQHHELLEEIGASSHSSAGGMGFNLPSSGSVEYSRDPGLSRSPFDAHPGDSHSPWQEHTPRSPNQLSGIHHEMTGLYKSPTEAQYHMSPDVEGQRGLGIPHSPEAGLHFDTSTGHPVDMDQDDISKSPVGMAFDYQKPHEEEQQAASYISDVDLKSPAFSRPPVIGMDFGHHEDLVKPLSEIGKSPISGVSAGNNPFEVTHDYHRFGGQNFNREPQEDEYPVHEVHVSGGRAIPEVSDNVDSTEIPQANMPPIHSDLMYHLQAECPPSGHPADSTTLETLPVGFVDLSADRQMDER